MDNPRMILPRTDCPVCRRDTAILPTGLLYRHDPHGGRTPDLKSCPGSLKPVEPPVGALLLFVHPSEIGFREGPGTVGPFEVPQDSADEPTDPTT
jgi:hypothetical protein